MKFILIASILALPFTLAAPLAITDTKLRRVSGPSVPDSYIVVLKKGADRHAHIDSITPAVDDDLFDIIYDDWSVLNAYAAKLGPSSLEQVLSDPNVDYVEQNGYFSIKYEVSERDVASNVRRSLVPRAGTGEGVDIYSIDTGVYIDHEAFTGRARWGATFGDGYPSIDDNGHGTHTMGIAAGVGFGPATSASIIAVKVLDDWGSGTYADVISGINWVANAAAASGKPSVANMSLGGPSSSAVDDAVTAAITAGTHFTVAAGNSAEDLQGTSPAEVAVAVTVGAIDNTQEVAYFSNFGAGLDVWFLGVDVLSTWTGSTDATEILSGTSMAAPGVAGILAVEISNSGNKAPADLVSLLQKNAIADVIGAPTGTNDLRAVAW